MSKISLLVLSDKGVASKERFFEVMDHQLSNLRKDYDVELRALPGVVGVPVYAQSRGLAFKEVDLSDYDNGRGGLMKVHELAYEANFLLVFRAEKNSDWDLVIAEARRSGSEGTHVLPFSKIAKKVGA